MVKTKGIWKCLGRNEFNLDYDNYVLATQYESSGSLTAVLHESGEY